jgi:uncharacterized membrane protein (DUF485 family)
MANTDGTPSSDGTPSRDRAEYRQALALSLSLTVPFLAIYFLAAIITTRELATIAAIGIWGLPLGFYVGVAVLLAGVVVTRIFLMKTKTEE